MFQTAQNDERFRIGLPRDRTVGQDLLSRYKVSHASAGSGMRARKNEIEELKQQLHQYSSRENDNKSVSLPPHASQQHVAADAPGAVGNAYR